MNMDTGFVDLYVRCAMNRQRSVLDKKRTVLRLINFQPETAP